MDANEALRMVGGGGAGPIPSDSGSMDPMRALRIAQEPSSGQVKAADAAPGRTLLDAFTRPAAAFAGGVNRGLVSDLAGLPVDTAANLMNLGIAGYGTLKRLLGGQNTEMPEPIDKSKAVGSSSWIYNKLSQIPGSQYAFAPEQSAEFPAINAGGRVLGASPGASPAAATAGVVGGMAGAKTHELASQNPTMAPWADVLAMTAAAAPTLGALAVNQYRARPDTAQEEILRRAQEKGMVTPPSQMDKTSVLETIGGKGPTENLASNKNTAVRQSMVADDFGITPNQVTPKGMEQLRNQAGLVYEQVKQQPPMRPDMEFVNDLDAIRQQQSKIRQSFPNAKFPAESEIDQLIRGVDPLQRGAQSQFNSKAVVDYVRQLRSDAMAEMSKTDDPASLATGHARKGVANALEDLMARNLQARGQTDLMDKFLAARQTIAKTHSVQSAMDPAGRVDPHVLAKQDYLSGNLKTIADYAETFPRANKSPHIGEVPLFTPFDLYGGIGIGGAAAAASGNPMYGLASLGLPALRWGARQAALTSPIQSRLLPPAPMMSNPMNTLPLLMPLTQSEINGSAR